MRALLALLLFLPAFAILTALYLRRPASARWSVTIDRVLLLVAAVITVVATIASWHLAVGQDAGNLWPDVAAALAAFHTYPLILLLAWWLRRRAGIVNSST
ncbi:MAG: hypothetical protein KDI51_11345 [Xanthomonadales bacterium]|nr:hypothetical protein [Xanthomonadales bacterium]MCB1635177.1 hypothetical protein [Xanthomonadales bacterium]